jgi:outer membrane biosynthesis protein TonB
MVPRPAPEPDYTQRETANATAVVSSMKSDLVACYKKRLRVNPLAQGAITVEIEVGEDGHVRKVDTTGASVLGQQTMACISHRIEKGAFEPPHGGGNIYVEVPFSLEVVSPDHT